MEDETRGFIESTVDEILGEEVVPEIEWIREEIPISSFRDILLGYLIGLLSATSTLFAYLRPKRISREKEEKIDETIRTMIKRRLPEIVEKINKELNR